MTEHLTRHMIEQLETEAGEAGDAETMKICWMALYASSDCRAAARIKVAEMINDARAMGASGCRVEVVA